MLKGRKREESYKKKRDKNVAGEGKHP